MKSYSVKELSALLHTNPETVRRWIRAGKLRSQQTPTKGENIILESDLMTFVQSHPKYASFITGATIGTAVSSPFTAIAAAIASGALIELIKAYLDEKDDNRRISKAELLAILQGAIAEKEKEYNEHSDAVEDAKVKLRRCEKLRDQTKQELDELKAFILKIQERRC